jgi:hypothetical protein
MRTSISISFAVCGAYGQTSLSPKRARWVYGCARPDILAYAAEHDLIVLTHDVRTMPAHFAAFLMNLPEGQFSPGVWCTPQRAPVGLVIQAILETWLCSRHDEYRNRELRLP